jgi:hypothetical protein
MPDIKDSVGEGGANRTHDVAMVQLMLRLVKDSKQAPYLSSDYDGSYGPATKSAIIAFQKDQQLIADPATNANAVVATNVTAVANAAAGATAAANEKSGLIAKGSRTLAKLSALVPAAYANMRIIDNTKTVYLPMDAATHQTNAESIGNDPNLNPDFRGKVRKMADQMFDDHKISLSTPRDGRRRTFAEQMAVALSATGAGPGESNHQYGRAVDIGFQDLQWISGNGDIKKENYWLSASQMPSAKQQAFWNARNTIATAQGLFKTNKTDDLIHLQAYDDNGVSYGRSLVALLNSVHRANHAWAVATGHPNQYKSDFGLGGATYPVGSARQIWSSQATVTKADLAAAINIKLTKDKNFNFGKFFGDPPMPMNLNIKTPPMNPNAKIPPVKQIKEADIKLGYITKIQKELKGDFEAADANWNRWTPKM